MITSNSFSKLTIRKNQMDFSCSIFDIVPYEKDIFFLLIGSPIG